MDSGLFCIAAGLGLWAVMRERFRISRCLGILIAVWANLHFAADLAGFSFSMHNLMPHGTAVLSPAEMDCIQMPPATSVVFFLFGCGLALLSKTTSDHVLGAVAALGTVMTSICVIVFAGYKAQFFGGPLQTNVPAQMSILTILCSSSLGVGLCAMLWKASRLTRRDLSTSGAALTVIGLILLFGGVDTALFVNARTTHITSFGLDVTYGRIKAIKTLVGALSAAETGERGFLLTGDEKFLAAYLEGMAELKTSLDDPELNTIPQFKNHDLQNLIVTRTTELVITVQMQRRGQHQQAVDLVKTGTGLTLIGQIESETAAITKALQADVIEQTAIRERSMELVTKTVMASYLVAVILIALALYIVWAETKRRNAVEKALHENELSLEGRVEERTRALRSEIAARAAVERELRQAQKLLDTALTFGNIAAWVWDCNADRVCWTGNMRAIFGRASSELDTFVKFRSFIHPNDRSRIVQKIATSVASGADYNDRFRILLPRGDYRWINGIGAVVRDENGLIVHLAGINALTPVRHQTLVSCPLAMV